MSEELKIDWPVFVQECKSAAMMGDISLNDTLLLIGRVEKLQQTRPTPKAVPDSAAHEALGKLKSAISTLMEVHSKDTEPRAVIMTGLLRDTFIPENAYVGAWITLFDFMEDEIITKALTQQSDDVAVLRECESCEGTGRIEMAPDSEYSHPCDTCQPEGLKEFQRGHAAAEHCNNIVRTALGYHINADSYGRSFPDDAKDAEQLRKQETRQRLQARALLDDALEWECLNAMKKHAMEDPALKKIINKAQKALEQTGDE